MEELSRDIPALVAFAGNDLAPAAGDRALPDRARRYRRETRWSNKWMWSIRWAGGFESRHELRRPVCSYEQLDDFEPLRARLGELRRAGWRSPRIAEQLNEEGFRTPKQRAGIHRRSGSQAVSASGGWYAGTKRNGPYNHRSGRRMPWQGG